MKNDTFHGSTMNVWLALEGYTQSGLPIII